MKILITIIQVLFLKCYVNIERAPKTHHKINT